ncbi:hypothetical protein AM1_D0043 (plasmid) [Acaryochloris marina MBIC11017]|uniref:Uncharacterized protein n=1 Tax=Acaryochloris marina (strain MBIC 11017) TaxID=329726 RepID=A8ZNF4_ACAM1|nr:hypothetical protein AM1_D0043 [Acaryochloris marina MBIC11017]
MDLTIGVDRCANNAVHCSTQINGIDASNYLHLLNRKSEKELPKTT